MRVLVTGGAGFIGSHYVRSLLADAYPTYAGAEVTVLDALTYAGNLANLAPVADSPRLRLEVGDVGDVELLEQLLPAHDAVVHFAAQTHVDRSISSGADFVRTNVLGTQALLEGSVRAGVPRVVVVSTDEVYGSIDSGSWPEDAPLKPNSPYAASKAGGDLLARTYWHTHGLDVRVTRCANNYGPYQHPEKLSPRLVTRLLQGRTVPLYGDGLHVREWLHVDDHCRAVQRVLEKGAPGGVYHVAGTVALTNRALTERLLEACGAGWDRVEHVPDRKGHDRRYSLDDSRTRQELGYAARTGFEQGLAETVRWYRENSAWWWPLLSDSW